MNNYRINQLGTNLTYYANAKTDREALDFIWAIYYNSMYPNGDHSLKHPMGGTLEFTVEKWR